MPMTITTKIGVFLIWTGMTLQADPSLPVPTAGSYIGRDGAITIVGYNDMREMMEAWTGRFASLHPEFKFNLVLKGTRTGPPALASGASALAPMGAEFSPEELASYRMAADGDPLALRVAHCSLNSDALSAPVAIIVHKDNPLSDLTLTEVADIFSGRTPRGLHPCGLEPERALGLFFCRRVLKVGGFAGDFRGFGQSADVVAAVAADPFAIGFAAAQRVISGVKMLSLSLAADTSPVPLNEDSLRNGSYPLDRFLLLYARKPLEPWVSAFLRMVLSTAGQEDVGRSTLGYLPLSQDERRTELAKIHVFESPSF